VRSSISLTLVLLATGCCTARTAAVPDDTPAGLTAADVEALRAGGVAPATLRCNGLVTWSYAVGKDAKRHTDEILDVLVRGGVEIPPELREGARDEIRELMLWRLIRAVLVDGNHNNLGVVPVRGLTSQDGKPVLVFRTGITPNAETADSCVRSLVEAGRVRHVLNLYNGSIPTRDLDEAEARVVEGVGGTYLLAETKDPGAASWRSELRENPSPETHAQAMATVARVINEQILRPGGARPKGNIHVHCGGGMHRTGMLLGVVERCINGTDEQTIVEHYRRHTAYESPDKPGGYEQENVDFVLGFDCSLLNPP